MVHRVKSGPLGDRRHLFPVDKHLGTSSSAIPVFILDESGAPIVAVPVVVLGILGDACGVGMTWRPLKEHRYFPSTVPDDQRLAMVYPISLHPPNRPFADDRVRGVVIEPVVPKRSHLLRTNLKPKRPPICVVVPSPHSTSDASTAVKALLVPPAPT